MSLAQISRADCIGMSASLAAGSKLHPMLASVEELAMPSLAAKHSFEPSNRRSLSPAGSMSGDQPSGWGVPPGDVGMSSSGRLLPSLSGASW